MGLFSSIANIFAAPGKRKAASNAAAWQQAGLKEYIDHINGVQGASDAMFQPYQDAGTQAQGGINDLLGLSGADAQGGAISGLEGSPLFQSLMRNGQNSILANGAATGGLRGGNVQHSLANFSADTLAGVIQQQLSNLGGVASQGLNATGTRTAQDNSTADTVGNLLSGIDQSKGNLAIAKNAITNQQYGDIAGLAGDVVGAIFGVPGLGGNSGGGGLDISSLLGMANGAGGGSGGTAGYDLSGTTAANPFSISPNSGAQALGSYQRSQGGGIANSLSSFLQGMKF